MLFFGGLGAYLAIGFPPARARARTTFVETREVYSYRASIEPKFGIGSATLMFLLVLFAWMPIKLTYLVEWSLITLIAPEAHKLEKQREQKKRLSAATTLADKAEAALREIERELEREKERKTPGAYAARVLKEQAKEQANTPTVERPS